MNKKVLFLCTGNSCRSQMAEGFAKKLWKDKFEIFSAGIEKHGVNKIAIEVMGELGIDLSVHSSKLVDEIPVKKFDYIVTVCDAAHETCPYFHASKIIHHSFEDPPQKALGIEDKQEVLEIYRKVRDQIKEFVQNLDKNLES